LITTLEAELYQVSNIEFHTDQFITTQTVTSKRTQYQQPKFNILKSNPTHTETNLNGETTSPCWNKMHLTLPFQFWW